MNFAPLKDTNDTIEHNGTKTKGSISRLDRALAVINTYCLISETKYPDVNDFNSLMS
jgi:hypothetical protein